MLTGGGGSRGSLLLLSPGPPSMACETKSRNTCVTWVEILIPRVNTGGGASAALGYPEVEIGGGGMILAFRLHPRPPYCLSIHVKRIFFVYSEFYVG